MSWLVDEERWRPEGDFSCIGSQLVEQERIGSSGPPVASWFSIFLCIGILGSSFIVDRSDLPPAKNLFQLSVKVQF